VFINVLWTLSTSVTPKKRYLKPYLDILMFYDHFFFHLCTIFALVRVYNIQNLRPSETLVTVIWRWGSRVVSMSGSTGLCSRMNVLRWWNTSESLLCSDKIWIQADLVACGGMCIICCPGDHARFSTTSTHAVGEGTWKTRVALW